MSGKRQFPKLGEYYAKMLAHCPQAITAYGACIKAAIDAGALELLVHVERARAAAARGDERGELVVDVVARARDLVGFELAEEAVPVRLERAVRERRREARAVAVADGQAVVGQVEAVIVVQGGQPGHVGVGVGVRRAGDGATTNAL